jgi:hypothetical protein
MMMMMMIIIIIVTVNIISGSVFDVTVVVRPRQSGRQEHDARRANSSRCVSRPCFPRVLGGGGKRGRAAGWA